MNNIDFDLDNILTVYNNDYFSLIKKFQTTIGIWPYQSGYGSLIRRYIAVSMLMSVHIPFINGARKWCGININTCCENLVAGFFIFVVFSKLAVTIACENKLKKVYQQLAINWLTLTDPEEQAIMIDYAKLAKIKAIIYLVYICAGGFSFTHLPMVPVVLNLIMPLNESREKILFVNAEYIVDPFEHYYKIYMYLTTCTVFGVIALASVDTTYTIVAHQTLGAFSVVKHRLIKATLSYNPRLNSDYNKILQAVYLHKHVLEFVTLIEASYSGLFLLIIMCSVLTVSACAVVGISTIFDTKIIMDTTRVVLGAFGVLVHLFYLSWPGQILIDQSHDLYVSIYSNEWYNISQRGKKMLNIIMLKCMKPCTFTAGGLYVMNFENFGGIVKTTITYVTVAVSFRE